MEMQAQRLTEAGDLAGGVPRVAFPMRVDALDKPGGDLVQVQAYIEGGLGAFNGGRVLFRGEILVDPDADLREFDLVHLTNLDRPVDTYAAYRAARAAGRKVVFSTIHHSYREIAAYEKAGRGGAVGVLSGLAGFRALEMARSAVRSRRYRKLRNLMLQVLRRGVRAAQVEMLLGANRVLVLTGKERRDLEQDCPGAERARFTVVPNARLPKETVAAGLTGRERSIDVCVVGRIEARKNQIAILEAVERLGVPAVFVGAENPNHATYCKRFQSLVAASGSKWVGALSHAESLQLMRNSKVHVSASWFEVFSLVDVEAYDEGCRLVSSICGGTAEWLGDRAHYVQPGSVDSIAQAIQMQLERPSTPGPVLLPGWGEVVEQLATVYQEVLAE